MAKIERRGRNYGYGGAHKLVLFAGGIVSGVILISLLVFTLYKGGLLVVQGRLMFGGDVARYGILWLVAFVFAGVFEESLTRGFLLYTLARGFSGLYRWLFRTRHSTALGFWTAAVILSVIFFLGHTNNPGESPVGLLSVFLAGMFFSLSVWWTGSVWWGIGMHAAWDWGQSFLFGVADSGIMFQHHLLATHPQGKPILSGGTTGPEGSIFVLAVLALGSLMIIFTLPKGRYLEAPPEDPLP
jgi:membrane protease YdiL (CAAX protease family)